ncbi:MAG: hypothetical protein ACT4P7_11690, partial [Gemmatimonadaceae bacterium]
WQLSIAIATFLTPTADGKANVGTGFSASAQDMGGAAKEPSPCASTGRLEARIARMLRAQRAGR